jgi:hypothetical protein
VQSRPFSDLPTLYAQMPCTSVFRSKAGADAARGKSFLLSDRIRDNDEVSHDGCGESYLALGSGLAHHFAAY